MGSPASIAVNGAAIREIRKLVGIDVNTLAAEVEVNASYISNIESGRRNSIPPHLFRKIAFALHLPDVRAIMANPYAHHSDVEIPAMAGAL